MALKAIGNAIKTTVKIAKDGPGHISDTARSKMTNKNYASMLNGLTKPQLEKEKAALERQLKNLKPIGLIGKAFQRQELQQKLDLVNKELQSRPGNFFSNITENMSRAQLQKEYATKTTSSLQSELSQLYKQRETEQNMANQLRGMGANVQSQFDSHYDKDSMVEKRIGAIEAELTKRGASLTKPPIGIPDRITPPIGVKPPAEVKPPVAVQPKAPTFEEQRNKAITVLWNNFGWLKGKDSIVSVKDLQKALNDKKTSPELRNAINFILNNSSVLRELDTGAKGGNADGKISVNDMKAILKKYGL